MGGELFLEENYVFICTSCFIRINYINYVRCDIIRYKYSQSYKLTIIIHTTEFDVLCRIFLPIYISEFTDVKVTRLSSPVADRLRRPADT